MSIRKSLRDLSKREVTLEEIDEYQKQIDHETNDRGACILMATNVELALNTAIFRTIDTKAVSQDELTDSAGPANTFAQKITLGRALRIYGEDTHHNLDFIRLIRNAFAHSHAPISFETKEVKDAVAGLRQVPPLPPVGVAAYRDFQEGSITSRNAFRRICDITGHNLLMWAYADLLHRQLGVAVPAPVERKPLA